MPIIQLGVPSTQHELGRGRREGGATMTGPLGPPSAGTEITHAKAHKGVACKQTETHAHSYYTHTYIATSTTHTHMTGVATVAVFS